jgi:hypothetical protein
VPIKEKVQFEPKAIYLVDGHICGHKSDEIVSMVEKNGENTVINLINRI